MTNEELLIPRYKVIAEHPSSRLKLGQVFHLDQINPEGKWHQYTEAEPVHLEEDSHVKYPAIFKRLEWWEERNIEDMPKYLKVFDSIVVRIIRYNISQAAFPYAVAKKLNNKSNVNLLFGIDNLMPATEQEYKNYINADNK